MKLKFLFLIVTLFSINGFVQAQNENEPVKMVVTKNDGTLYIGFILEDDGRELLINTEEIGKVYIPKLMVKKIETYSEYLKTQETVKEEVIKEEQIDSSTVITETITEIEPEPEEEYISRLTTKYIQTDNAYPLRRGDAFVKLMPVGLEAQFPIKKNWSMGVMTSYIGAPLAVKSKVSFKVFDSSYISLDMMYGSMIFGGLFGAGISDGGALATAGFTFGNRRTNFTIRGGYAMIHQVRNDGFWDETTGFFVEGEDFFEMDHYGIANFGGIINISDKLDIVLDLVGAFGTGDVLVTGAAALRFGPSPQHRFQTGLALALSNLGGIPIPIPALSYTYVFNQRKGTENF